ncbi:DUF3429 domain-containing protein [Mangrovicella endophytica]|uniref:DUF3429 domain-containing protein n=1 Tax=Mangrovicella endophytica TaxID=2066697 RepID=UPI000C9DF7A9|nr:DUF3429 domain-containing protein [Mangrovicella endophytica]
MTILEEAHRSSAQADEAVPPRSRLLGWFAVLPLAAGTLAMWLASDALSFLTVNLTLFWGAALLIFLGGVRRGYGFALADGGSAGTVATAIWLFAAGFLGLLGTVWGYPIAAAVLEIAGFLSLAVLDPIAARRGEAPRFFARLRPSQMLAASACLAAAAIFIVTSPIV